MGSFAAGGPRASNVVNHIEFLAARLLLMANG